MTQLEIPFPQIQLPTFEIQLPKISILPETRRRVKTVLALALCYGAFFAFFAASVSAEAADVTANEAQIFTPLNCGSALTLDAVADANRDQNLQRALVGVKQVCFGKLVHRVSLQTQDAFQFQMSNGTTQIYLVAEISPLVNQLVGGAIGTNLTLVDIGNRATVDLSMVRGRSGRIGNLQGTIGSMRFHVPELSQQLPQ